MAQRESQRTSSLPKKDHSGGAVDSLESSPRVLHVIDCAASDWNSSNPGGAGPCVMRLAAQVMGEQSAALVLGSESSRQFAARVAGLNSLGAISPAAAWPFAGRRELKRLAAMCGRRRGEACEFDVVHAWTERAAALASLAWPRRPLVFTPQVGPASGALVRAIAADGRRPLRVLAATREIATAYLSWRVPASVLSVELPGVDAREVDQTGRERLRKRWSEQSPLKSETFVIGLLGEPVCWSDARMAASVAARVAVSGRDVRLVLHSRAARRMRAMRVAADLGQRQLIILDDELSKPWQVISGLDAGLVATCDADAMRLQREDAITNLLSLGRRAGERCAPAPLPWMWALAAGLPVVAERSETHDALMRQEPLQPLMIDRGDVNAAADRFVRLCDARSNQPAPQPVKSVQDYRERILSTYAAIASAPLNRGAVKADVWR